MPPESEPAKEIGVAAPPAVPPKKSDSQSEKREPSQLNKAREFVGREEKPDGSINVAINIGDAQGDSEISSSDLWFPEQWYSRTAYADTHELNLKVSAILCRHVLILDSEAYGGSGESAAVSLCQAVSMELKALRRFQGSSSKDFTLRRLMEPGPLKLLEKSIGFLDFTDDPSLVSMPRAKAVELEKRLRRCQCFAVVLVDGQRLPREGQSIEDGEPLFCGFPVWRVSGTAGTANAAPAVTPAGDGGSPDTSVPPTPSTSPSDDPLISVIRFVTAVFPGLEPAEFEALVDFLLVDTEDDVQSQNLGEKDHKKGNERKKEPPTRLQRWRKHDRDSLIREAGVSFRTASPDLGASASATAPGYGFTDGEANAQIADTFFANAPIFSTRCLPGLTRRFFSPNVSEAFRLGYMRYVMRLHADRLSVLTPAWLTQRFYDGLDSSEPGLELGILLGLFHYVLNHHNDAHIAEEALGEIARRSVDLEDQWLRRLMQARYSDALNDLKQKFPDKDTLVLQWGALGELTDACLDVTGKLGLVHEFLLLLVDRTPVAVTNAILVSLTGSEMREEFRRSASDAPFEGQVTVVSAKGMVNALRRRAESEPRSLVFSGEAALASQRPVSAEIYPAAAYGYLFGDDGDRKQASRLLLLSSHISALQELVGEPWDRAVKENVLRELLLDETTVARCGSMVAQILIEYGRIRAQVKSDARQTRPIVNSDEVFDVYLGFARALVQANQQGLTTSAGEAMAGFTAPLRNELHPLQRVGIIEFSRDCLDGLRKEQDQIRHSASKAEMLKLAHRVAIIQTLIKGFMMTR
jgi:hypothetical protein